MPNHGSSSVSPAVLACLVLAGACGDVAPAGVPDRDVLVVTSAMEDEVRLLDPATGDVVGRLDVDARPGSPERAGGVAVEPGGDAFYVVLGQAEPALWSFRGTGTEPDRRLQLTSLRDASRVAVAPDGRSVAVGEYFLGDPVGTGGLGIVDFRADSFWIATPCPSPYGLAWDARGRRLAVTCPTADAVVLLDGSTFETRGRFMTTPSDVAAGGLGNPVTRPMGIAWSPAGDRIWVALYRERRLGAFTPAGEAISRIDLGGHPVNLQVTGRGRYVVVVTRDDATVTVVDSRTGEAVALPLPDADSPHDLALSPDGRTAFVAYEGTAETAGGVVAVDLDAGEVLWTRETGPMTTGIAYRPAPSSTSPSRSRRSDAELMQ